MLGKIRLCLVAGAALASSFAFGIVAPAEADVDNCVVAAAPAEINWDTPSTSDGLYYPTTDPNFSSHPTTGPFFTWRLNGTCLNNGMAYTSSGTAHGWCGRSVGEGTGTLANGASYTIQWQSAGSQLVFMHPSARGSVNAQPNPPGSPNGSCLNGTATTFIVDGALITGLGV